MRLCIWLVLALVAAGLVAAGCESNYNPNVPPPKAETGQGAVGSDTVGEPGPGSSSSGTGSGAGTGTGTAGQGAEAGTGSGTRP
jgi:hypothetical protein